MSDIIETIEENVEEGLEEVEEIANEISDAEQISEKKGERKNAEQQVAQDNKKIVNKKPKLKYSSINKSKEPSDSEQDEKELEKKAEKEPVDHKEVKSLEQKKKELLAKAKKLKEKIEKTETKELKEKVKIKKRTDMLIPLEDYVKSGIYIGTKVITPAMRPFVYRRRADGLAIFNTDLIDEKLKEAVEFLSKFDAEDIILVCKRKAGWKAAEMFHKLTGIRIFTQKYPAGILTNTTLPNFFENELTIVIDSWLDKNALNDTLKVNKKVLMVCDTNNFAKGADQIIIGNNKSVKSLGVMFYLLTRGYCKAKKIKVDVPDLDWWTAEEEKGGARFGV